MNIFIYYSDMLGCVFFALSGILLASKRKMDPIGVMALALATAVGGGTIRDVILEHGGVFWCSDPTDIIVTVLTTIFCLMFVKHPSKINLKFIDFFDALGLGVFVIIGVNHALNANVNSISCVLMGVLTGVGGGVLRDVLARRIPLVFKQEIYALACVVGAIFYIVFFRYLGLSAVPSMVIGMIVTWCIRLLAMKYHLRLPLYTFK